MRIASSRLSIEAQAVMDAQTEVKQFVKRLYLQGVDRNTVMLRLAKVIKPYLDEIQNPQLKQDTETSLQMLAMRTYYVLKTSRTFGDLALLFAVLGIANGTAKGAKKTEYEKVIMNAPPTLFGETQEQWRTYRLPFGTQVQLRVKYYMKDVTRTVQQLAGLQAEDETEAEYTKRKNSMRATAEMIVRAENHERQLAELRAQGVKLVIISTHADCSKRCSPFQGKVYSLDGTSGVTPDGRRYVPIERATDIYYTTKAGRVWKNGLFGFNCRHYAVAYQDYFQPPMVDEAERKKQVAIDQMQRAYEREIVKAREEAIAFKDVDIAKYKQWKAYSQQLMKEYIKYSHDRGRPYYTSRVRIL